MFGLVSTLLKRGYWQFNLLSRLIFHRANDPSYFLQGFTVLGLVATPNISLISNACLICSAGAAGETTCTIEKQTNNVI